MLFILGKLEKLVVSHIIVIVSVAPNFSSNIQAPEASAEDRAEIKQWRERLQSTKLMVT